MKPAVLIAAIAFAAGAGLVRLAMPFRWVSHGPPVPTSRTAEEAVGVEHEASYEAVEPSDAPFDGIEVELTGEGNRWLVGRLGWVAEAPELAREGTTVVRLPPNSRVRLTLTSRDYVYLLALPKIDKSQVAVPGQAFPLEFRTAEPGTFVLRGSHVCGPPSRALDVTVRVEPKENP